MGVGCSWLRGKLLLIEGKNLLLNVGLELKECIRIDD